MEENVEELIREAVEAAGALVCSKRCDVDVLRLAGVIAEVDEGTEQELVSLAANPQPFPPPVLMEAPDHHTQVSPSRARLVLCI